MNEESRTLQAVHYGFPVPDCPYYHLTLQLEPRTPRELIVMEVRADGRRVRDLWVYNDGRFDRKRTLHAHCTGQITLHLDWENGSSHTVEVDVKDAAGKTFTLTSDSRAPDWGGYWDPKWKYYAANVLRENDGLTREGEPVHLLVSFYADRLTDPEREVRVVGLDPVSGAAREVPCQVFGVSTWDKVADEHLQPTTTLEVVFLGDVPADAAKVYLVFYGNPEAVKPSYGSDLVVSGEGLGLTVENNHYRVKLHPDSGAIDEVLLKQGVNVSFAHHMETNGALHWNPGVYAPPREWIHASDWNPPAGYKVLTGPLFCSTQRWGELPQYPEVKCSITYSFYANQPYIMISSVLDVVEDIDLQALRNGEFVLNQELVDEFAWKGMNGAVNSVVIKERPRHPESRALDLDAKTPWFAFFNRPKRCALAVSNLDLTSERREGGPARWEAYRYLHWGPWYYCARPLVYTNATNNPQRVMRVPGASSFYERMAVFAVRLGGAEEGLFTPIEDVHYRLAYPLTTSVTALDTDARVPDEWVPPILVSEFEEREED